MIGFIDHLLVVTTNNFNTIADFHTTNHSTLSKAKALNNGYSSAMFLLDVSW
jgi:hypothetical protein